MREENDNEKRRARKQERKDDGGEDEINEEEQQDGRKQETKNGTGRGGEGMRARVGPIRPHATAARQSRGTRTTLGGDRQGLDNTRQD